MSGEDTDSPALRPPQAGTPKPEDAAATKLTPPPPKELVQPPGAEAPKTVVEALSPQEARKRAAQAMQAATSPQMLQDYPVASKLFQRWLSKSGGTLTLSNTEFNLADPATGFQRELVGKVRGMIATGLEARRDPSHPHHMHPGDTQTLTWTDSVRAIPWDFSASAKLIELTSPKERDLAVALGGYTYSVAVDVRLDATSSKAEVLAVRAQIVDRYNWFTGKQRARIYVPPGANAPPLPPGAGSVEDLTFLPGKVAVVNDSWFRAIEVAGEAKQFGVRTEVQSLPTGLLGGDFVRTQGAPFK